jgi:hypothetical protein
MDHPGLPRVWAFSCIRERAGHSPWMGFSAPTGSTFLFTPEHKAYLPQLDPAALDEDAVCLFFEEMGYGFEEAGMAARDALTVLHEQVAALGDEDVLLLHVG